MTWYALRITTILIIILSLLFVPAPVSRAHDRPTEAEIKQAQEAATLFLNLLEETGDFSRVIDEMYVEDFIERYLLEQIHDGEESNLSTDLYFTPGLLVKRDLLKQARIEDWRSLYIATNNFIYHVMVISLNKEADDLLNGREPEDEKIDNLIPPKVIKLFNNHPILKDLIDDDEPQSVEPAEETQDDAAEKKSAPKPIEPAEAPQDNAAEKQSEPKPIETPEEMRSVTETLREGLRLLLEEQGDRSLKLTGDAKKAIEMIREEVRLEASIHVSENEYFGFPARVRFLEVPTSPFFWLTLAEVNGKQRVVWGEVFVGD